MKLLKSKIEIKGLLSDLNLGENSSVTALNSSLHVFNAQNTQLMQKAAYEVLE